MSALFTAAQIERNCPDALIDLGKRVAAHLTRAAKADQKANDHRIAAGKLLAEAKAACDDGGFAALHARFCPELGRSRAYELLSIATGKKTGEELRAENAERNRRLRARKKAAETGVRHVTERTVSVEITEPTECPSRVSPPMVDVKMVPLKRPVSKPMSPDEFLDRAFPQLEVWRNTLAEMAENNPAGARTCVEKIAAQLHAAINEAIDSRDAQPMLLQ